MADQNDPLRHIEVVSYSENAHKAVILVSGIHEKGDYFEKWEGKLSQPDNAVLGYTRNHQTGSMTESAHELAGAIKELKAYGITDVHVISHSMGGLVAKAALNELAATGESKNFNRIEFDAFGAPWGGFAVVDYLPAVKTVSKMIDFPMAAEMSPHSAFMQSLAADWPSNMQFNVYHGTADTISGPEVEATKERFAATVNKADSMTYINDFKHDDYVNAGTEVMSVARGQSLEEAYAHSGRAMEPSLANGPTPTGNAEAPVATHSLKELPRAKESPDKQATVEQAGAEMSMA
jgi:pimeloyl-ACP methyl ester carboxylesterase